jgi:hypothetical protein
MKVIRNVALALCTAPFVWLVVEWWDGWVQTCCGEKYAELALDPSYVEVGKAQAIEAGYSSDVRPPCFRGPIPMHLQVAASAILPVSYLWLWVALRSLLSDIRRWIGGACLVGRRPNKGFPADAEKRRG